MREFFTLFACQFLQYFIVTVNYRAVAQARYFWTFVSDLGCAANSFYILKRVGESRSKAGFWGYTLGGALGSLLGIAISKLVYHQ